MTQRALGGLLALACAVSVGCGRATLEPDAGPSTDADGGRSGDAGAPDASTPDASAPWDAGTERWPLGVNDVSFLLSLEPPDAGRFGPAEALVPRAEVEALAAVPPQASLPLEALRVVAVRFDLCDRSRPGPCPSDGDGVLRLVLQPVVVFSGQVLADDAALHAFYPVPRAELASVVTVLRRMARLSASVSSRPLGASTAADDARFPELKALVLRYASAARLTRLTLFAQPFVFAQVRWVFRGLERQAGVFKRVALGAGSGETQQEVLLGSDSWEVRPLVGVPTGLELAVDRLRFNSASPADRGAALQALDAIDNPDLHGPDTVECAACHVATLARAARGPAGSPSRYTSPLPLALTAPPNDRSMRIFGYLGRTAQIAQRVANDSAQVATEIEQRFPATP